MSSLHIHAGTSLARADHLKALLSAHGLSEWHALATRNWQTPEHGGLPRWREAVGSLPTQPAQRFQLNTDAPEIGAAEELEAGQRHALAQGLEALMPWRKGPFLVFGTLLDAEWHSDWKWHRVAPHIHSPQGRRILDVGSGNGYTLLRLAGQGAQLALGVDPSWLANMQFAALTRFLPADLPAWIIPARLEDAPAGDFDSVFSMGVLHHRREPEEHLQRLHARLRPGGELVLETLIHAGGAGNGLLRLDGRYANMRNVWILLTPERILQLLHETGFQHARCVDRTPTTIEEQRRTAWMPFHSLAEALDPTDPSRTVEGHPAPVRAIFVANR